MNKMSLWHTEMPFAWVSQWEGRDLNRRVAKRSPGPATLPRWWSCVRCPWSCRDPKLLSFPRWTHLPVQNWWDHSSICSTGHWIWSLANRPRVNNREEQMCWKQGQFHDANIINTQVINYVFTECSSQWEYLLKDKWSIFKCLNLNT